MTIPSLIDDVQARGIELWAESGQLRLRAPKGALTEDVRERLVANKAAILAFLHQASAAPTVPAIAAVDRAEWDRLPLSFAQERLWFIHQLEPESPAYNVPAAVSIRGELDIDLLERAYNAVIARHETLRTIFPARDGVAEQRILDRLDFRLNRIDVSGEETRRVRRDKARLILQAEARRPFDLATGPLVRGTIVILSPEEHLLLLNMHHIISDAWSMGVLVREIGMAMDGVELPGLPIQFVDYSVWQRTWLETSELLERQLAYWQRKLAGAPESLDLVTDHRRSAGQSSAGATYVFALDAQLTGQLNDLARRRDCSLFMVLLAAFKTLLYRYTGQEDLCIGTPIANRQYRETENLIGMFANTLVLRSQVEAEDDFARLLAKVRATCLEAYEHQDAPFERIVERVQPARNLELNPLFQIMMILQNAPMGALGDHIRPYPLDSGISKFDLLVSFIESADGLAGTIEYKTSLFEERTVARMAAHFTALCRAILAAPGVALGRLQYVSEAERRQLLTDFNRTDADYARDECIHERFTAQVAAGPERKAVVCGGETLTYRELHDRSRALALHLQSLGVGPDSLVGLRATRSVETIVGVLGILQAGGAVLPLDPRSPDERLAEILRDSRPAMVLVEDRQSCLSSTLKNDVRPQHLAYVIYTSGSTGRPKGVLLTHITLTNLIAWQEKEIGFREGETILNYTEPVFDVFMQELFSCLSAGATFVIPDAATKSDPASLARFIVENDVHTIFLPFAAMTTLLGELMAYGEAMPLRKVITAGEQLTINDTVSRFFQRYPEAHLHNHYGPSEAHVVTAHALPADLSRWTRFPPIGKPIANTRIYVLDRYDSPQPIGVPGELHIAGDGLARGYLNRPELDRAKFVPDPFRPGARMYRTGDLGRWLPDGTLEFLGRIDTQVKIRGYRVEPGEIEARLRQHPEIEDCVVVAQGEGIDKRLVAFYRASRVLSQDELRTHLMRTLPEHMVPSAFVSLDAIPLTATGKVDRRALERMDVSLESSEPYMAPRSRAERQLAGIWAEVLNRAPETVGVNDNFFELGGHSLLATQLMFRIRTQLGVDVPLKALFERGNIAGLAQAVDGASSKEPEPIRWNEPFRLLKVQRESILADRYRPIVIPVTYLVTEDVSASDLQRNLAILLEHPLFKLRLRREGDQWLQCYDAGAESIPVETVDAEALMAVYDAHAPKLDPVTGPVAGCFVVDRGPEKYVLLLVEHFISDPVTVIVLMDLLSLCCQGREDLIRSYVSRPSLGLQEWVETLERRAGDEDVLQWRDYWWHVLEAAHASEGRMIQASGAEPEAREERLRIPRELVEAAEAFGSVENVILALFARSCAVTFQEDELVLTQIYNTRQDPLIHLDSSQALGWFSENYPLALQTPRSADVLEFVRDVCAQKKEIEERRLSFTLLSHYNDTTRKQFEGCALPGIYFNYQGRGDAPQLSKARRSAFFEVFNASAALGRIADVERFPYWLSCMARIEDDDDLHLYLVYRADKLSGERMRAIVDVLRDSWAALRRAQ